MVTTSEPESPASDFNLKPGQLWRWNFLVNDGSWLFQRVSTEGRTSVFADGWHFMKRGDVFTVVTVDDPGPYDMRLPKVDDYGMVSYDPPKRWHVVLFQGTLLWFDHECFSQAELVTDAE